MAIKRQIYIIVLIFFLLCVSLVAFFICPLLIEIQRNSGQIILQKKNVSLLISEFNDVQGFYKKYEDYKPNLDKIDQMFADSQNPVDFIEFIEEKASDFKVKIEISTPFFYQEEASPFAILQISCSGDFSDVLKLINSLETGKYLIEIQNLDMGNYKEASRTSKKVIEKTQALLLVKVLSK